MLKAGLTGNIGSGKSYTGKIFTALGIPVYNSDISARQLMDQNSVLIKRMKEVFGDAIYQDGLLHTERLSSIAFESKSKIETLNSIVHPFVKDDFEKWCSHYSNLPYVIIESAIIFESGFYRMLDKIILVSAPEKIRMDRVFKRDGMNSEGFLARQQFQTGEEEKIAKADFVILNDGMHPLLNQITGIDDTLRKSA
jgi:dephospho-CoA kinase